MIDDQAAQNEILAWVSKAIQVPVEEIDLNKPFADLGLDSLDAVHMISMIESLIRQELPEDVIERTICLNGIFDLMRQKLAAA